MSETAAKRGPISSFRLLNPPVSQRAVKADETSKENPVSLALVDDAPVFKTGSGKEKTRQTSELFFVSNNQIMAVSIPKRVSEGGESWTSRFSASMSEIETQDEGEKVGNGGTSGKAVMCESDRIGAAV